MKAVIAIGGNALVEPGGTGDIREQFARSRIVAKPLADLVEQGWQVTVTHGNGPQVGSIMMRMELSSKEVYPIDLGLAVANTQAGMGYMIAQTWRNELRHRGDVVVQSVQLLGHRTSHRLGAFALRRWQATEATEPGCQHVDRRTSLKLPCMQELQGPCTDLRLTSQHGRPSARACSQSPARPWRPRHLCSPIRPPHAPSAGSTCRT